MKYQCATNTAAKWTVVHSTVHLKKIELPQNDS